MHRGLDVSLFGAHLSIIMSQQPKKSKNERETKMSDDKKNDTDTELPPLPPLEGDLLASYGKLRRFIDAHCICLLDAGELTTLDVLTILAGTYLRWCRWLGLPEKNVENSLQVLKDTALPELYKMPIENLKEEFRDSDDLAAMLQTYVEIFKQGAALGETSGMAKAAGDPLSQVLDLLKVPGDENNGGNKNNLN